MLRVRQLALVAHDLDPVVDDLKAVFGVEVAFNDPGVASFGLKNAVIPVGHQFVEVVAPIEENTAGGRYLDRRNGDGGYMVILQCDDHPPYKQRVDELGIRKVAEAEEKNYSIMQLHPADTSGSFLEIDVQVGGEDFEGPWMPAGKNWQKAIRQEKVDGIAAAEVQSPDPAAVADRWSKILDIAVGHRRRRQPVARRSTTPPSASCPPRTAGARGSAASTWSPSTRRPCSRRPTSAASARRTTSS